MPTNFISFYTSANRCPTIFLYRLSGKIEGPLLTVLRPYYAQKTERTSSYLTLHSFFWYALHKNVANRRLSILCVFKYPWTPKLLRHAVTVTGTVFFKEHLSNPHFACSWDSPTHYIVRALPSNKPPFQYTHFTSYHPPWVNRGFIKGEAMRLLWTISSKSAWRIIRMPCALQTTPQSRRYPTQYIERCLSNVNFDSRQLPQKKGKEYVAMSTFPQSLVWLYLVC